MQANRYSIGVSLHNLTCRCRFCGYILSYSREDVGLDARCPQCAQTIRYPGKLASVATIVRTRRQDAFGWTLELLGFSCMFILFPFGPLAGAIALYFGWRRSNVLLCGHCHAVVPRPDLEGCSSCRTKFSSD